MQHVYIMKKETGYEPIVKTNEMDWKREIITGQYLERTLKGELSVWKVKTNGNKGLVRVTILTPKQVMNEITDELSKTQ